MAALSLQPGWQVLGVQLKSPASLGRSSASGVSATFSLYLCWEKDLSSHPGCQAGSAPALDSMGTCLVRLVGSGEHQGLLSWGEGTLTACLGWNEAEISVLGGPGIDSFEKMWRPFLTALESLNPQICRAYLGIQIHPQICRAEAARRSWRSFPARSFLQLLACLGTLCVHAECVHHPFQQQHSALLMGKHQSVPSPNVALTLSAPRRCLGVSKWGCSWGGGLGYPRIALLWHFLPRLVN